MISIPKFCGCDGEAPQTQRVCWASLVTDRSARGGGRERNKVHPHNPIHYCLLIAVFVLTTRPQRLSILLALSRAVPYRTNVIMQTLINERNLSLYFALRTQKLIYSHQRPLPKFSFLCGMLRTKIHILVIYDHIEIQPAPELARDILLWLRPLWTVTV